MLLSFCSVESIMGNWGKVSGNGLSQLPAGLRGSGLIAFLLAEKPYVGTTGPSEL